MKNFMLGWWTAWGVAAACFFHTVSSDAKTEDSDQKRVIIGIFDLDRTIIKDLGTYILTKGQGFSNPFDLGSAEMPDTIEVYEDEFNEIGGPYLKDKLGYYKGHEFALGLNFDTYTTRKGVTIRPAYYFLSPENGYLNFTSFPGSIPLEKQYKALLKAKQPHLDRASPFLSWFMDPTANFNPKTTRMEAGALSFRRHNQEDAMAFLGALNRHLGLKGSWNPELTRMIGHEDHAYYERNKVLFVQELRSIVSRIIKPIGSRNHLINFYENDVPTLRKYLEDQTISEMQMTKSGLNPLDIAIWQFLPEQIEKHGFRPIDYTKPQTAYGPVSIPKITVFRFNGKIETFNDPARFIAQETDEPYDLVNQRFNKWLSKVDKANFGCVDVSTFWGPST